MKIKKIAVSAVILFVIAASVAYAETGGFSDVPTTHWAYAAISKLAGANIVHGYADGSFKPNNTVTRAEVASMVYSEHQAMEEEITALKSGVIATNAEVGDTKTVLAAIKAELASAKADLSAAKADLAAAKSEDSIVINTIANTLPSVVVITTPHALGAGVFIDSTHVLTANHVIQSASSIQVTTVGGTIYQAVVAAQDANTDLAVLQVATAGDTIKAIEMASSYTVGETVIAVGHPAGLEFSVSKGIISKADRTLDGSTEHLIQYDAAISPGNSGGPLVDINGKMIGIVNEKFSGAAIEGLGIAISLEEVKAFLARALR